MWNHIEFNWHLMIFFAMQYIHLLDTINQFSITSHVKDKNCDVVNKQSLYSIYLR